MVEEEFFFGENEDKPHRTLMVKAQKKNGGKSRHTPRSTNGKGRKLNRDTIIIQKAKP
jgi:hypothetical protein